MMPLKQMTDAQLKGRLDYFCTIVLASCELDYDFEELEKTVDSHYHEANRRGYFV